MTTCVATLSVLGLLSVRAGVVSAAVPPRDIDQLRQADLIVVALTTGSTCIEMGGTIRISTPDSHSVGLGSMSRKCLD